MTLPAVDKADFVLVDYVLHLNLSGHSLTY
jgi:hypothetical protein